MATENTNTLSKYKDIISRSVLIHPGSPDVYQLNPKKKKIGTLTKMTVGEKNLNKINKTILLVGETGTGKSTLINALVNYTMGVTFEDNIWFEIVEGEKRSQSESQTSDVIVYEIFGFEDKTLPYSLTIIDTPGYGDSRMIEHGTIVSERLFDLFHSDDGVHEINAVGLVMKASENQLSDRLRYIFDSVMSLFGKDMENKFIILITHSSGMPPENALQTLEAANIKCAKNEENQPVHFLFDSCSRTQRTVETGFYLKNAWGVTMRGIEAFEAFVKNSTPQKLKTTVEVMNSRLRLTTCIENLHERIMMTELKQTEIEQTREALKKHQQEMEKNEKFTIEVDEIYKEKKTIQSRMWGLWFFEGAVCCKVCEENCHYPGCTMGWGPEDCIVMINGRCTVCTGKCPISAHVKENWIYVSKTTRVTNVRQEMKVNYEKNKSESEKKVNILKNLEKEMHKLTVEHGELLEESYQHVVRLDQIALNVDSLSTYVYLDFLIEKMKEKGDTEKVRKLKEMKNRVGEGTRYVFGK